MIDKINAAIAQYFEQNPEATRVPAKDLMPSFIAAGIFKKDHRKGYPIREVLRELDFSKRLHEIPTATPERNEKDTYWYFERKE